MLFLHLLDMCAFVASRVEIIFLLKKYQDKLLCFKKVKKKLLGYGPNDWDMDLIEQKNASIINYIIKKQKTITYKPTQIKKIMTT